jgi:uncharacterized protein
MAVPLFFGEGRRRLFGVYDPAVSRAGAGSRNVRAIVFCPPWGPEYYVTHGALRRLATNLSLAGHHVLRFDYFGVGDSAGESEDGDLDGWCSDIEMAVDELLGMTRISRICLIGMRLGATLAASFARNRKDVDALVLWDPVFAGREYLDELKKEHTKWLRIRTRDRAFPETDVESREGTRLPPNLEQQIAALDLPATIKSMRQEILLIITQQLLSHGELATGGLPSRLTVERVADRVPWQFDTLEFGGPLPKIATGKILDWIR